jgi:DNA-binding transcriptional ArsR family regulator
LISIVVDATNGAPVRAATDLTPPRRPVQPVPTPARFRSTIASIVLQPEDLRDLRAFHKALADVNRLRIVRRLAEGEASVAELIAHVGLSQPLVSHHLKRLRVAGLVETRRVGRETICTLRPEAFGEVAERQRAILGIAS